MVVVMTTRRPHGVSYLAGTLLSIGRFDAREMKILSDGPLTGSPIPAGWSVEERPWRGARVTGWECLRLALEADVEDLILLQDDIVVCDGGGSVMDECPVPDDCIATTFYSMSSLPRLQPKNPGAARLIVVQASGTAQALKLPRRSIEYLCQQDLHSSHGRIADGPHQFDDVMFALARKSQWPNVAHLVPNVVRHIGQISACNSKTVFHQPWSVQRGRRFPGDVMDLAVHKRTHE